MSEADFSSFLSGEVASRFKDGLTVIDAQDLSPRPAGGDVYGPAKVVVIVLPGHPDDSTQLDAIRAAYKTKFNQQSVLELTHQDCVSYWIGHKRKGPLHSWSGPPTSDRDWPGFPSLARDLAFQANCAVRREPPSSGSRSRSATTVGDNVKTLDHLLSAVEQGLAM